MVKFWPYILLVALALSIPVNAQADESGLLSFSRCVGCLYGQVEPIYMHRVNSEGDTRFLTDSEGDLPGMPGNDVLIEDTGSFHYGWSPGVVLSGGYQFSDKWAVEGVWTWLDEFSASLAFDQPGSLNLPFESLFPGLDTSDFTEADQVDARATSDLQALEIRGIRNLSDNTRFRFGLQKLDLDETFLISSTKDSQLSTYDIRADNAMLGVNIGLDTIAQVSRRLAFEASFTGGIYRNKAKVHQTILDLDGTLPLRNSDLSATQPGFTGSATLGFRYLVTDNVAVSLNYRYFVVAGLVVATEQVNFTTADLFPEGGDGQLNKMKQDGYLQYNGPSLRFYVAFGQ